MPAEESSSPEGEKTKSDGEKQPEDSTRPPPPASPTQHNYPLGFRARPVGIHSYDGDYRSVGEYADALRKWMAHLYYWQCVAASFPCFLASLHMQTSNSSTSSRLPNLSSTTPQGTPTPSSSQQQQSQDQQQQQQQEHQQQQQQQRQQQQQQQPEQQQQNQQQPQQQQEQQQQRGIEYVIPPLWKRLVAELVDFLLLFVIKVAVTYAAVDTFDLLSDVEKYDFENLGADLLTDYKMALEMTSEILVLELIHRIGNCVFEALCLHRGTGGVGGATPGKKLLGLRVVRCEWLAPTLNEQALVYPGNDLGLGRAITRSVVKNFSLTFLLPICFTLFNSQQNRTVYDIIAGSVVVEERVAARNNAR